MFAPSLTIGACITLFFLQLAAPVASAQETSSNARIRWLCSTEKSRWQELTTTNAAAPVAADSLKLDPKTTFQTMDGFGGCFNELGWEALVALPAEKREAALKELFAPEGANFTLCRAPIGANDFSLGWYSLNETPGDYEMKHFSIERNREALIPFIKAAMKYQPKLGVWAVAVVSAVLDDHQWPLPPGPDQGGPADARRLRALFFQIRPGLARRGDQPLRDPPAK